MTEPTSADDAIDERTQEQRATETIQSIFAGGNLAAETLQLSNDFTDRHEARMRGWFVRRKPRRE